jgi:hypothetical protein
VNPIGRVYRWSILGGIVNSGMAAAAFAHHDVVPGVWLIVLTVAMGAQAMMVQRLAKRIAISLLGGSH